jgi:D-alanine-D-alanine ligase
MQKLRVGVLMGGRSVEKEVSFNSGRTICDHLDSSRYDVIPIFQQQAGQLFILPPRFLCRGKISDFEHRLTQEAQAISWDDLKNTVDFMYLAIHGRYAEDGTAQGMLEVLGIPYLGAKVFASALGMDKIIQKDFLRMHGIDVARDIILTPHDITPENSEQIISRMQKNGFTFPCVVKPHKEGSSLGMTLVTQPTDLYAALQLACTIHPGMKQDVLVEEKIEGMEFTCIILTDYLTGEPILLPPTEVVPENGFFDYEQKYMPGRATKFTPARCSTENIHAIQLACLQTMRALEFENIARIDGFLTSDGRVVIIDPNSLTGMAPSSFLFRQAAEVNMNHTHLINHLIETELQYYGLLQK